MDVIRSHAARLPALDDRWTPGAVGNEELLEGLRSGAVAGPEITHPLDNVLRNIRLLHEGDPDKQFGMTRLQTLEPEEILELVGRGAGFEPDPSATTGPVPVDPERVLDACGEAGDRFAEAIRHRERVILATGHPVGLAHLYIEVGRLLRAGGATIIEPADGTTWHEVDRPHPWQIRYLDGVAMLTDKASARHTHSGDAMERMLDDLTPDLVFADHGFAGAAIERGVDTVSIADVNDPALLVAQAQRRTRTVIVMDDNVAPQAYWPCFQAIAARLP
ncbi:MAG TPA: phosphatase [Actinomycetota bacterium]|nr:phosphatase [Actinomycetota bacterium]